MAKVRITAESVYTLDSQPISNGFVEFNDEDGTIMAVGQCDLSMLIVI